MKTFLSVILAVSFLVSCAGTQVIPEGCENSVIYASGIDVNTASIAMRDRDKLLILGGIEAGEITKDDVLWTTASMRDFLLTENPTYTMFSLWLNGSSLAVYFNLFAELVPVFNQYPGLISMNACDLGIILGELYKIDALMAALP